MSVALFREDYRRDVGVEKALEKDRVGWGGVLAQELRPIAGAFGKRRRAEDSHSKDERGCSRRDKKGCWEESHAKIDEVGVRRC